MKFIKKTAKLLAKTITIKKIVLFLTFFALAIRLQIVAAKGASLFSDSAIYTTMARYFLEGDFAKILHPHWRPLYPLFTAAIYPLVKNWTLAPTIVSAIAGSLLVIPVCLFVFYITKSRLIAFLSGFYTATWTPLIQSSIYPRNEALLALTTWTAMLFLWKAIDKRSKKYSVLSGIFFALSYLTKNEGGFYLIGFVSFLCVSCIFVVFQYISKFYGFHPKASVLKIIRKPLLTGWKTLIYLTVGFILVYGPYQILMNQKYGFISPIARFNATDNKTGSSFVLINDGTTTWAQESWGIETANPESEIFDKPTTWAPRLYRQIVTDRTIMRATKFYNDFIITYIGRVEEILFVLGVIWIALFYKKRWTAPFLLISTFTSFWLISFFAPNTNERYVYYLIPFIPIIAGFGVKLISDILAKKTASLTLVFVAALFATSYLLNHPTVFYQKLFDPTTTRQSSPGGNWLAKNTKPGTKIMATHEREAFYGRSQLIYLPHIESGEIRELIDYANLRDVEYLVLSESFHGNDIWIAQAESAPEFDEVYNDGSTRIYLLKTTN